MAKEVNAITLLTKDHKTVSQLFEQSEKAEGKKKEAIFEQINAALTVHATVEEEIFYPAVKKARSEEVKDEVREGYAEHAQIKRLLAELSKMGPSDEMYGAKFKVLKEDVEHHVKEEEGEMFPDAKKFLKEDRLEALGAQLEQRKEQLEGKSGGAPKADMSAAAHK